MSREHVEALAFHAAILRDKGVTNRQLWVAAVVAVRVWPKAKSDGTPAHAWTGTWADLALMAGYPPTRSHRSHIAADVGDLVWLGWCRRTGPPNRPMLTILPPYRERPPIPRG